MMSRTCPRLYGVDEPIAAAHEPGPAAPGAGLVDWVRGGRAGSWAGLEQVATGSTFYAMYSVRSAAAGPRSTASQLVELSRPKLMERISCGASGAPHAPFSIASIRTTSLVLVSCSTRRSLSRGVGVPRLIGWRLQGACLQVIPLGEVTLQVSLPLRCRLHMLHRTAISFSSSQEGWGLSTIHISFFED